MDVNYLLRASISASRTLRARDGLFNDCSNMVLASEELSDGHR